MGTPPAIKEELLILESGGTLTAVFREEISVKTARTLANARGLLKAKHGFIGVVMAVSPSDLQNELEFIKQIRGQNPTWVILLVVQDAVASVLATCFSHNVCVLKNTVDHEQARLFVRRARLTQQAGPEVSNVVEEMIQRCSLTKIESEMLLDAVTGRDRKEMCKTEKVSVNTVKSRVRSLLRKCGASSMSALTITIYRSVLLPKTVDRPSKD